MAVGANVSGLIAQVAAALPDGSRVLAPEPEFVSLLFPFLAQAERGVTVEVVPLDRLAEAIDASTDVVAVSAVQSSTGEVADLDAIEAAAHHHGALTVIDATHGIGWLPFDASRYDAVACASYKWLMCPRGTAFMVLSPDARGHAQPRPGRLVRRGEPADGPVRPAAAARATARAGSTPRPPGSAGSAPSRRWSSSTRSASRPSTRTTSRSPTASGPASAEPSDSAIVSAAVPDATEKLARAGIMAAARAGRLSASFHLYNTEADVDAALTPSRRTPSAR